jgi:S1-C subfamily serine protease
MKKLIPFLLLPLLFTNCATIFNSKYQNVKVETNDECTMYVDGEKTTPENGRIPLERDLESKTIKFEKDGYLDYYTSAAQYKLSPTFIFSVIPGALFFVIPPVVDLLNPKTYNYKRKYDWTKDMTKDIDSLDFHRQIKLENIDLSSYESNSLNYSQKHGDYIYLYNVKVGPLDIFSEKQYRSRFSEFLETRSGKENKEDDKYITNQYSGKVNMDVKLKSVKFITSLNKKNIKIGNYDYVMDYVLKDAYGDTLYQTSIESSSGVLDKSLRRVSKLNMEGITEQRKMFYKMLDNAIDHNLVKLFRTKEFLAVLNDTSQLKRETEFEPLTIAIPDKSVSNLDEATKASVTIRSDKGHGSGFIISRSGYILTNHHVIAAMDVPEVVLNDGTKQEASIIRTSKVHDIALLKIPAQDIIPFKIDIKSDVFPGTSVYAIGTPASSSLNQSVSKGIVSAKRKDDLGNELIQTDASVNPGNSGGVLTSKDGQVVGVVSSKMSGYGVEGIAFGIPIKSASEALKLNFK